MAKAAENQIRTEYVSLRSLKTATRNPKLHAHDGIQKSVTQFGFMEPIVIDDRTGKMVAGHGRREALLELLEKGEAPPKGIALDGKDWLVPVVRGWKSANDAEAEAALLAVNKLPEAGGWDLGALQEMLGSLSEQKIDLSSLGFSSAELDQAIQAANEGVKEVLATDDGERNATPEEALDTYNTTSLRQIVLVFQVEEYETVMGQLANVREIEKLDTNAAAVKFLLGLYKGKISA